MVLEEGFSLLAEANEIADLVAMEVGESPVSNRVGRGGAPRSRREIEREEKRKKREDKEDTKWLRDEEVRKPWKRRVLQRDIWERYAWTQTEMDRLNSMRKAEARMKSRRSGKRPQVRDERWGRGCSGAGLILKEGE